MEVTESVGVGGLCVVRIPTTFIEDQLGGVQLQLHDLGFITVITA